MAHTAKGSLAELIQAIEERGLPMVGALKAQLNSIFEQMVLEDIARGDAPVEERGEEDPYMTLAKVLDRAFDQASGGKGKDRHVKVEGQRFEDQPICTLQHIYGNGYAFGQVGKKMEEAQRLPKDRAVAELLGAINYIAAAVVVIEDGDG